MAKVKRDTLTQEILKKVGMHPNTGTEGYFTRNQQLELLVFINRAIDLRSKVDKLMCETCVPKFR